MKLSIMVSKIYFLLITASLLTACAGDDKSSDSGQIVGAWQTDCYLNVPYRAMAITRYEFGEQTYTAQTQLFRHDCDSESLGAFTSAGEYFSSGETVMASGVTARNINLLDDTNHLKLDVFHIQSNSLYWGNDNLVQTASEPSECPEDTYSEAFQDFDSQGFLSISYNCFARPTELNFDLEYRRDK